MNYKYGKYTKNYQNKCKCGKNISPQSKRCQSCDTKYRWSKIPKKKYYCIDCGKEISKGSKNRRCWDCYIKNNSGKNNPNYKDGRTLKQHYCKLCGDKIHYSSVSYKNGLCLSCSQIERFKNKENKENFIIAMNRPEVKAKISKAMTIHGQGYEPYSKEFTQSLRNEIRERDNNTCQCCGMTQEQHFDKYDRDLEIHHIDHNKFNCSKDNLITTCKQCNINANKDIDYWYAFYTYKTGEKRDKF